MKRVMKSVRMVAQANEKGVWTPLRFQFIDDSLPEKQETIYVEQVLERFRERIAGNLVLSFRCCSTVHSRLRQYELCYDANAYRWYVVKW